tara:strand:+ start:216 stop:575 length:360 start_codon:yes stop_codon:yes gene_type:complete
VNIQEGLTNINLGDHTKTVRRYECSVFREGKEIDFFEIYPEVSECVRGKDLNENIRAIGIFRKSRRDGVPKFVRCVVDSGSQGLKKLVDIETYHAVLDVIPLVAGGGSTSFDVHYQPRS